MLFAAHSILDNKHSHHIHNLHCILGRLPLCTYLLQQNHKVLVFFLLEAEDELFYLLGVLVLLITLFNGPDNLWSAVLGVCFRR